MRILRILSGALLAAALVLPVSATPAFAHVALIESDPKDGASLDEAPDMAVLKFSETLDAPSTKVAVTDANGDTIDAGPPEIEGSTLTQPLRLPAAGEYTVGFHIVSEDGHPVEDSVTFSVDSVPEENKSTTSAPDESAGEGTGDGSATDQADGASGVGWGVVAGIAAAVAALVVAAVLLLRRRSRHS